LPAVHTVPAVGYAVSAGAAAWVFSGDTGRNAAFWQRVNQLNVGALVVETAFSNRERELADRSLHLSPHTLASELDRINGAQTYPIYITHTKPAETALIMDEILRFDAQVPSAAGPTHDIRWLRAGEVLQL
jgi:ribonuclease BN (tRNA processing enzyme)